jgi:hypothetical protein
MIVLHLGLLMCFYASELAYFLGFHLGDQIRNLPRNKEYALYKVSKKIFVFNRLIYLLLTFSFDFIARFSANFNKSASLLLADIEEFKEPGLDLPLLIDESTDSRLTLNGSSSLCGAR